MRRGGREEEGSKGEKVEEQDVEAREEESEGGEEQVDEDGGANEEDDEPEPLN